MFMGFIKHFIIIFGTNLLTQSPVPVSAFFLVSVFHRKGISNGVQMEWNLWECDFWNERDPGDLECKPGKRRGTHEIGGAPTPLGVPSTLVGPLLFHRRTSSSYIYIHVPPKHPGAPRKPNSIAATFCTREIPSWGLFGALPEGAITMEGLYINSMVSPVMCE